MVNCEGKASGMAIPLLIYLHGNPPQKSQSCSGSNGIISFKWIRFHISRRVRVVLTQMESYPLNGLGFTVIVNHANKELL